MENGLSRSFVGGSDRIHRVSDYNMEGCGESSKIHSEQSCLSESIVRSTESGVHAGLPAASPHVLDIITD